MTVDRIVTTVRLGFSVLFLWMVIDGPWVKLKGESFGVFDAHGGSGFGIVAVATGALILLISLLFLTGKEFEFRYFQIGRHQLLLVLTVASFTNVLGFLIITHSGSFRELSNIKGAGWGAAGACLIMYFFPQLVITGLGSLGTASSTPLTIKDSRTIASGILLSGVVLIIAPMFEWFKTGEESWTGYQPGSPRIAFLILIFGGVMTLVGCMRLRTKGLAEPGGRISHPHLQLVVSLSVLAPLIGWLVTDMQREDMSSGIGVWVAFIAGLSLLGFSLFEFSRRKVTAC